MNRKHVDRLLRSRIVGPSLLLMAGLAFYAIGIKVIFVGVVLWLLISRLRFPEIVESVFARTVFAVLIFFSIGQAAALIQFFIAPNSQFMIFAALISGLILLLLAAASAKSPYELKLPAVFARNDLLALLCAAFFAVPIFALAALGDTQNLASMGGLQGIDGVNHFAVIAETASQQHLDYAVGHYYPKSFHLVFAFVQDAFGLQQASLRWDETARLFFAQYAFLGALLLLVMYYFAAALVRNILGTKEEKTLSMLSIAITLGAVSSLFYLSAFVHHGFLSYFYIVAAIIAGLIYSISPLQSRVKKWPLDERGESLAFLALITAGASLAWPLWTPALVLIIGLLLLKDRAWSTLALRLNPGAFLLGFALLLHAISVVVQLMYSTGDSTQGINLTGGLRTYNYGMLAFGVMLMAVLMLGRSLQEETKILIAKWLVPMLLLIVPLSILQYILFDEVRYYAIKLSMVLELVFIVIATVSLVLAYAKGRLNYWLAFLMVPLVVGIGTMSLFRLSGNPFQEAKEVARGFATARVPKEFKSDVKELSAIGTGNRISQANTITMHISEEGKLYTHMQLFYWADMMEHAGTVHDRNNIACSGAIYGNLFKQDFSESSQQALINQIRICAALAKKNGVLYYIITDDASYDRIKQLFGDVAKIV